MSHSKIYKDVRGRPIPSSDIEEYKIAFKEIDVDNSGSLDRLEIQSAMAKTGWNPSEKELDAILDEVDLDGNGTLDFSEFCMLMSKNSSNLTDDELAEAFSTLDSDGSGFLDEEELRFLGGPGLSDEEIKNMMADADFDKDGRVGFEDFKILMRGY